ncbi:MAG: alpha/beta fold hydrolase [Magnetovibrionaceae bacterium]
MPTAKNPSTAEKISFTNEAGDAELAARFDRPAGPYKAIALFAHCFTCSKDIFAASRIAAGLVDAGFAVLRFDFTGLGASEGEFANTNFSSNVGDLKAAARWLTDHHMGPTILIGHSLGGAAVLAAAGEIESCKAVCTIGAPADPAHVAHHFTDAREEIESLGEAEVLLVGRPFKIKKQFLEDIESQTQEARIGALKAALLVCHAPLDQTVGIENAEAIYRAAKHPKSFLSLDSADHLLSRKADAAYVADVIAAWAGRYLHETGAPDRVAPKAKAGEVLVKEAGQGKFLQDISVGGRFPLLADEPVSVGGTDLGPGPYDLLLAGLGACTAMTIRMYADRKKIPLDGVEVSLNHDKVHAEDCAVCETKEGKVDRIQRRITLSGNLNTATRTKLLEIADKCPVHRTLHSEVLIETEEEEGA